MRTNHYQIELLTNLDQVPEAGAIVVANFPKAERRLRLSRTGLCYSAIIPEVLTA
jgi:hypothetical protein